MKEQKPNDSQDKSQSNKKDYKKVILGNSKPEDQGTKIIPWELWKSPKKKNRG